MKLKIEQRYIAIFRDPDTGSSINRPVCAKNVSEARQAANLHANLQGLEFVTVRAPA